MNAPPTPETFPEARPAGHPPGKSGHVGVLLVNLGTPEATDYWSMRRYLEEFLSDRRVIETPRWLWWPILNLAILTRRPSVKGRDYDSIWNKERDEGPLKTITRAQSEKLGGLLTARRSARPIVVDWAMRYGKPSIANRLAALQTAGCDRILLVPLYPQYCAASSATVCD
ncbi:MAG TPA: ferrochelatase, partial [Roseiarcus sp.]